MPIENGVANAYVDGTTMKNSGYELAVSVTPVRTKDFTWSLSFNTSKVKIQFGIINGKIPGMIILTGLRLLVEKSTELFTGLHLTGWIRLMEDRPSRIWI